MDQSHPCREPRIRFQPRGAGRKHESQHRHRNRTASLSQPVCPPRADSVEGTASMGYWPWHSLVLGTSSAGARYPLCRANQRRGNGGNAFLAEMWGPRRFCWGALSFGVPVLLRSIHPCETGKRQTPRRDIANHGGQKKKRGETKNQGLEPGITSKRDIHAGSQRIPVSTSHRPERKPR